MVNALSNTLKLGKSSTKIHFAIGVFILLFFLFFPLQYLLWLCDKKATHVSLWHGSHFHLFNVQSTTTSTSQPSWWVFFVFISFLIIYLASPVFTTNCPFQPPTTRSQPLIHSDQLPPILTTYHPFSTTNPFWPATTRFDQLLPVLTTYHPFSPLTTHFNHLPPVFNHLPPIFTTYHPFSPLTTHFNHQLPVFNHLPPSTTNPFLPPTTHFHHQPPISTTNCPFWITYHPLQLPTPHFGLQEGNLFYSSTL